VNLGFVSDIFIIVIITIIIVFKSTLNNKDPKG